MITIMNFVVTNKIEFRFMWIGTENGTFGFRFYFFQCFLRCSLIATPNYIAIVEWSSTWLWQWHQLTINIRTEEMKNDLSRMKIN